MIDLLLRAAYQSCMKKISGVNKTWKDTNETFVRLGKKTVFFKQKQSKRQSEIFEWTYDHSMFTVVQEKSIVVMKSNICFYSTYLQ